MKSALTIAGSDSGGGAGIQADIKSMSANGVYAMSVITAVTAQNTLGVQGYVDIPLEYIAMQMDSVFSDIFPDAVKTGMLSNPDTVALVADKLKEWQVSKLVVDPVMLAKGGSPLLKADAVDNMKKLLFPQALVITPNVPEAEFITGIKIENESRAQDACKALYDMGAKNILLKGGHAKGTESNDILYDGEKFMSFICRRIDTKNTHGTGCTLASAIAAWIAKGKGVSDAVSEAKIYIQGAIEHADEMMIGSGHGPVNHFYRFFH